jgi:hypothetical protein
MNKLTYASIYCLLIILTYSTKVGAVEIGFRNIKIGMTRTEVVSLAFPEMKSCSGSICSYRTTIRDAIVHVNCYFKDDELYMIRIEFEPDNYPEIRKALVDKYGTPKEVRTKKLTNLMGVSVDSEMLAWWEQKSAYISIDQYGDTISKGLVLIVGEKFRKDFDKHLDEKKMGPGF